MTVALSLIDPNPDQPRKWFDQGAIDELAESIRQLGLLQPLVVRPAGDRYEIVAGERRWRACRQLGLDAVPVTVIDADGTDQFVRSVAENVNRRDMTVMEEARAYQRLADSGMDVEQIASVLGKRPQDIGWRLDLLGLDPKLEQLADRSPDLAWHIARLEVEDQWRVWKEINGGMSNADAVAFAQALGAPQEEMFAEFTLTAEELETRDRVTAMVDRLDRAIGQIHDLLDEDDGRLAAMLSDRAATLAERLELAAKAVKTEARAARKVAGIVKARA